MNGRERLRLIAAGLPVLHQSAEELIQAEAALPREHQRARGMLLGQADEEAAKALILLDAIRCPPRRQQDINRTLGNFYQHLARLLYAEACRWHAMSLSKLDEYLRMDRYSHYLDGPNDVDFVYRNRALDSRDCFLYADLVDHNGELEWQIPGPRFGSIIPPEHDFLGVNVPEPKALPLVRALTRIGAFKLEGLRLIQQIWRPLALEAETSWLEIEKLNKATLDRLKERGLFENVSDEDIRRVIDWQFPMYPLDFVPIRVTKEEFEEERARAEEYFI